MRVASLLTRLLTLVRYRFFLFAGLLPFILGAAVAWWEDGIFNGRLFGLALLGIFFSVVAVESFNEYFDSRLGTDRVFALDNTENIPFWVLVIGCAASAAALAIGFRIAAECGRPVLIFAGLGGLAALFYVGPPLRWAYRGLGETMIFFSYGPWMTMGSYYVQTGRFDSLAAWASMIPGLLVVSLALANEIPDYYQDSLVGKRNLVVRFGRRAGCWMYLSCIGLALLLIAFFSLRGDFPSPSLASLAAIPFALRSGRRARRTFEHPVEFTPAVRDAVTTYLIATMIFTGSFLI